MCPVVAVTEHMVFHKCVSLSIASDSLMKQLNCPKQHAGNLYILDNDNEGELEVELDD